MWLDRGSDAKGRSFCRQSLREAVLVCRSERNKGLEKKGSMCGNSRSKSVLVIQNERTKELSVEKRQSALGGCLHVESTIDSYGEVIDRFGRRLAAEPLTVLTHLTAGQVVDPPAESDTSTWALSCEQARPGFVC